MKALNELIKTKINPALSIPAGNKVYGLVSPTKKQGVIYFHEYDDPNNNPVHIADNVDIVIYHRLINEVADVIGYRGKETKYKITARIDLILYSRLYREAPDYLLSKLSKVPKLLVRERDSDSWKILTDNTPKTDYNTNHDLIVISYDYTYTSDQCSVLTLGEDIEGCVNSTTDCVND